MNERLEGGDDPKAPRAEFKLPFDIEQIKQILPHRYPFLLVDRIIELEPAKRIVGIKNVTANEPFFLGHFPQKAVMPGVLLIEAMAQVGAVMALCTSMHQDRIAFLAGIDKAKFRRPVVPGDQLLITIDILSWRSRAGKVQGKIEVDGKVVTEAELFFTVG